MKNLIILSLVAIGLAKYVNAFVYPGSSKGSKSPSFSWNEFGRIGRTSLLVDSPNPERPRREADVESAKKQKQFVLGNVRLVKNGNFPGPYGIQQKARRGNSVVNSTPFQDEQEKPLFTENKVPVLEKDKASSSESSSNGQGGEPAAANIPSSSEENADPAANQLESSSSEENSASAANQEGSSSSEENAAPAANLGESSSSEVSNAPVANQEASSSSEENAAPAANQGESSSSEDSNAPAATQEGSSSSEENAAAANQGESEAEEAIAEVVKSFTNQEANLGLQPFVSVKPSNKHRALVFSVRDVDRVGRNSPRQGNVPGSRRPRQIATNFPELAYKGAKQGPQGQAVGAGTRKRGRVAKK
ncbi:uncharacterized protein LOC143930803 [Lithobates pipiens]